MVEDLSALKVVIYRERLKAHIMDNDTIAAISTPIGEGAIGIIRISGKDAISIFNKVFYKKTPIDLFNIPSHTILYGHILDSKNGDIPIDEVLVSIMRAPRTYTMEDTLEINCHGNPILLQKVLESILNSGARLAEPGEFTERAFLNGRIDLSQAESVIDLVRAKTEDSIKISLNQLKGNLSICIKSLQHSLKEILIDFEAYIDFPEDNTIKLNYIQIKEKLLDVSNSLKNLIETYRQGKMLKYGITTPIIGKSNVGKSSLFNILINIPSRALVTPIPGTTRDLIDDSVNVKGILFRFIDTAGLKKPRGIIEKQSLNLTYNVIEEAVFIIFLLDGSKSISTIDLDIWHKILNKPNIVVINKIDLPQKISIEKSKKIFGTNNILSISCKDCIGIDKLKEALLEVPPRIYNSHNNSDLIITNIRHKNILEIASTYIKDSITSIENKLSIEFIASDIRHALENLQELSGERVTDTILEDIFSKFCIGK